MYKLGLIGTPISHSFSKVYFDEKFKNEKIDNFIYELYNLKKIEELDTLILKRKLIGFNVTQPYKNKIIKHLDQLDILAKNTQSVNTVFIHPKRKKKIGFNTDVIGFEKLLKKKIITKSDKGLIIGSGGVSNTISYVLNKKNIKHKIVSRKPKKNMISYSEIENNITNTNIIINTTPLGQYPDINSCPRLPYQLISNKHLCIDLVYNPEKTIFLKKSESNGAKIINGKNMLITQAEASWHIWRKLIKSI